MLLLTLCIGVLFQDTQKIILKIVLLVPMLIFLGGLKFVAGVFFDDGREVFDVERIYIFGRGEQMIREIVMAGISVGAVIALAWWMDHPKKEVGSLLAVGVFLVIVVVAFLKNKNQVTRYQKMKRKNDK